MLQYMPVTVDRKLSEGFPMKKKEVPIQKDVE